jgi:phosphoenolpyruvate carboxylase
MAHHRSQPANETSDALDRDPDVFAGERSTSRTTAAYRSAMSALTSFINRGGKRIPAYRKRALDEAKEELRRAFGRD